MKFRKYLLSLLLFLPLFGHADGQEGLSFILDLIDLLKVFGLWAIIVFSTIILYNKYRAHKLSFKTKFFLISATSLVALFVWSMVKFDSRPFEGPIDSIVHKEVKEAHRKQDSINLYDGYADSTIDETIGSVDTNEIGIYIWLNKKRVFVRKHDQEFDWQKQEDSFTMSIVRSWRNR